MAEQPTALATGSAFTLVPRSFEEAVKIAGTLARSELVPKDYRNKPENVFVAVQWGQEIGLPPLQAMQNISVINGRPAIWGDAALAMVMAHPAFEDIDEKVEGSGDKMIARCTVKRAKRSPVVREFSVDDAKRARLWGKEGPWQQYPQRMLQLRARAFALRDAFPDAIKGIGIAEEVQDSEVEINPAPTRPSVSMPKAASAEPAQVREVIDTSTGEVINEPAPQTEMPSAFDEPVSGAASEAVEGVPTLSEGMLKTIRAKAHAAGLDDGSVAHQFGVDRIEAIPAASVNKVLDFIKKQGK